MSSLANSPCPLPSVASEIAFPLLFDQLNSAVTRLRSTPSPGLWFAPARPQLLPAHAPYRELLAELPHIGYCDVLIDLSDASIDAAYRTNCGFAFRVAWTSRGNGARLDMHALLPLTPVDHFLFGNFWVLVEDVWPDGPPDCDEGAGGQLVALTRTVRDMFILDRVPPELAARYGSCGNCTGCQVGALASYAKQTRAVLDASLQSLQCWPDVSAARIAAATRLLEFPVLPALADCVVVDDTPTAASTAGSAVAESLVAAAAAPPPTSAATLPAAWLPRTPAAPAAPCGVCTTAGAWEAACAAGARGVAASPLWAGLLSPELCAALAAGPAGLLGVLREEIPGAAWSFPLFTPEACGALMDATEQHEAFAFRRGIKVTRPNSMNRYGVILRAAGLEPFIRSLTHAVLHPVAAVALPLESLPGGGFTRAHSFIVAYDAQEGRDHALDMHTDASDVTFNVCLGKDFSGASLTFCGALGAADHRKKSLTYAHAVGRCIVHRGLQRHGADAISSGHRRNLIVWLSNSTFSELPCAQARWAAEDGGVDRVCASFTHDRDFEEHAVLPPGAVRGERAWCPHPAGALVRIK